MTTSTPPISDKSVNGLSRLGLSKKEITLLEKELRAPSLDAIDIDVDCFSEKDEDQVLTVIINCFAYRTKEIIDTNVLLKKVKSIFASYVTTETPLEFQIDRYS